MVKYAATDLPCIYEIDYPSPHLIARWGLFYAYVHFTKNRYYQLVKSVKEICSTR